ncbi:unnamed protein product [Malus baccata var. baccata]
MCKLGLLRAAITSNVASRMAVAQNCTFPSVFCKPGRRFSTKAENPTQDSAGLVYGKLLGNSRNTLKTDVVNMLEGCNLRLEDVKVDYNQAFTPMGMVVQFQSWKAFDNAARVISRKGRLYKLERANRSQWDNLTSYDGKLVSFIQGIPQTAAPEVVERFLSSCEYNSSSLHMSIYHLSFPESSKFSTVHCTSQTESIYALLAKKKGACQNGQILMRVLQ